MTGDVARVRLTDGRTIDLVIDDRALPDPTCGQYDDGHWAHDTNDTDASYFVSSNDGAVYEWEPRTHAHTALVGDVVSVSTTQDAVA